MSKLTEKRLHHPLIRSGAYTAHEYQVTLGREILSVPALFSTREWLLTNGIGGYASSSVGGLNTRGYHGLLVAAVEPAGERLMLVNRLVESVEYERKGEQGPQRRSFALDTNQYPDCIAPQGYLNLESFFAGPYVQWAYNLDGARLEKRILMEYGKNKTVVQYINPSSETLQITVRPLVSYRNFHQLRKQDAAWNWAEMLLPNGISLQSSGIPFYMQVSPNGAFSADPQWFYNVTYGEEKARGLNYQEDLYAPGVFRVTLQPGESCMLVFALEKEKDFSFKRILEKEQVRLEELAMRACPMGDSPEAQKLKGFYQKLVVAADRFIVKKPDGRRSIIAGYPWFEDWGRDTFISLPGLLLVTGRFAEAKEVLTGFSDLIKGGIVPNYIDPDGTAAYNSIDASLWYIYAVYKYVLYTGDIKMAEKLYPVLETIIKSYLEGTQYSIKTDWDNLLMTGPEGAQLTWMDAKTGDQVITPRWGKAVEINALWYNALCIMAAFEEQLFGHKKYIDLAVRVQAAFVEAFWSEKHKYLFDVIQGDVKDATLRPNQILAVSLPFKVLSDRQERAIVDAVEHELLTPFGLRTLPVVDQRYHGHYQGNVMSREAAYHQGTVWAWLIGPYIDASIKVNKRSKIACAEARNLLGHFEEHLQDAGILSVSEIFDGDSPHRARGAVAQAWSVAEILRSLYENLLQ